jgi:hypothetical protein
MPSAVTDVLRLHRAQLRGVIELRGVKRMRGVYEAARADLETRLAKLRAQGRGQAFTAHHLRIMLLQVRDGLRTFEQELAVHLTKQGALAGTLGARHLISATKKLEQKFTGHTPVLQVEQAAVLRGIYQRVQPSLLDRYEKSVRLYTRPVVEKIKLEMAQSIVTGEGVDAAVDRVAGVDGIFDGQRWRAERIVRTELSYSYGIVKQRTMEAMVRDDLPGMQKKLIETFDDRTGEDSKELHGQVQPVNKPFVWERKNSKGVVVETVEFLMPPNRSNDRGVAIPWRPEWDDSATTKPGGEGPGPVQPAVPSLTPLVPA